MSRRRKKLAGIYIVRRAVFLLLVLALLCLGACGIAKLLGEAGEEEPRGQDASEPRSQSQAPSGPQSSSRQESEPEPEAPEKSGTEAGGSSQADPVRSDQWQLILINASHPIEKELDIQLEEVGGYRFDSRIAAKVRELLSAAEEDGIHLTIISGYRTMERSRTLYQNKVAEYQAAGYDEASARQEAARWVAPPGTSEHHSGLAMDIVSSDYYQRYSDLVEAFAQDPEAVWLKENCTRFGFILRYPEDKEDITGINFEPWHLRYVGDEAAKEIMDGGLCLEEYLGAV